MRRYVFPTYRMDARAVPINPEFHCVINPVQPYGRPRIWSSQELRRHDSFIVNCQPDVAPWFEGDVPTSFLTCLVIKEQASNAAPAWDFLVSVGKVSAESSTNDAMAIDNGQLRENKGFGILPLLGVYVPCELTCYENQQDD